MLYFVLLGYYLLYFFSKESANFPFLYNLICFVEFTYYTLTAQFIYTGPSSHIINI